MDDNSNGIAKFEFTESKINVYDFQGTINENSTVNFQVLKLGGSVLIWIGRKESPTFCDLTLSMQTPYDSLPIASKILGESRDTPSVNLATRLTIKLKKPVYISFNLPADKFSLSEIEKRLLDEIKSKKDVF